MSTKNLARTIVEGGRSDFSKFERLQRNRKFRREERNLCRKLRHDPEEEGYLNPAFDHQHDHIDYADCLRPLRRWMEKHEGRDWSEVVTAIATNFSSAKMKDWHLRDHIRNTILYRYRIENGKLKKQDPRPSYREDVKRAEVIRFLKNRKLFCDGLGSLEIPIGDMDCSSFYWRIPSHESIRPPQFFMGKMSYCSKPQGYFNRLPVQWDTREDMTPEEFEYFRCLHFSIRQKIMNHETYSW